ncbi:MAG: hypothetical protein Q9224_000255 [Gallowayella concinna]
MVMEPATYPVKISFAAPGTRPPVYVAGSFTLPEWIPHELFAEPAETAVDEQTDYIFHRSFDIPKGEFQYKFRLGHDGDCALIQPNGLTQCTVIDALGNQNNVLVNAPLPSKLDNPHAIAVDETSLSEVVNATAKLVGDPSAITNSEEAPDQSEGVASSGPPHSLGGASTTKTPSELRKEQQPSLVAPENILRRRQDIAVSSSDMSDTNSGAPPSPRRSVLQRIFQLFKSILALLFRWKAA